MTEHEGAIEYDLLTNTGHELKDVGESLSWGALASFISNVPADSALAREANGEFYNWATRMKTNGILADIFDMLAQINTNMIAIAQHEKSKPVKPYPRPRQEDDTQKIGKGALPKDELREWFNKKRAERCQE